MGSVLIIIVVAPAIILIILPLRYLCCCQRVRDFAKKQLGLIFFNRIISFFDTSLLVITTCAWINIYQVDRGAIIKSLSYHVSVFALTLITVSLAALFIYLASKASKLES